MKTFIKLCFSVIHKNKGFTAGIFIMSALSAAIAFLGANLGPSGTDTVTRFISESGTPDAVYTCDPLPETVRSGIEAVPGVSGAFPAFIFDTNMETEDGHLYSVRVFHRDPDTPFRHAFYEKAVPRGTEPSVYVSLEFAEYNGLRPGDRIRLNTPLGDKDVEVAAIVSNPETMSCVRDDMSAYESYQFGYLYLDADGPDGLVPMNGQANQWLIYFDDGLTSDEQKNCMSQIRDVLGSHILSESLTEESDALASIRDDLHTISVLCSFIPGIIWLITLGFNFIFIKIIVENQRKTIGMLRALGFSIRRVVLIFISYTVMINLPAVLCGTFGGVKLLRLCLGLIASGEGIPDISVTIRPLLTALMLFVVFVIGIAAALFSAGTISRIDPSEAYTGEESLFPEPPKFIGRLRADAFFKISAVSLIRNYKRQIVGTLCITACIISMCVGFEGYLTIGHPIDAVYGGRYRYDLAVRGIGGTDIDEMIEQVTGVALWEPCTVFSADMKGKNVRVATLNPADELTVAEDAAGNRLTPADGVIIDEMSSIIHDIAVGDLIELGGYTLPVTGIAREILYPVMYISPETGAAMGHGEPNCVLLKTEDPSRLSEAERQITAISNSAYLVSLASQKEDIRNGFMAMRTIMLVFALLAFCIGSLLVLNISIIDFNENRFRYAALRALGTPVRRLGTVALTQNLFRVILGILLACPLCRVCVTVLLKLLSGASQQYVPVRYTACLILACVFPLIYILFGTVLSLRRIRTMDFCSVMNETE